MTLLLIIWSMVATGPSPSAQQTPHSSEFLQCATCHSCEIPTRENPCLMSCPRGKMITMDQSPEEGPGVITMDGMRDASDLYAPVVFSHRVHAEMSGMSGGCAMCHHYNPAGRVVPCKDCHDIQRARSDISKPDLKGAYHRLCITCHRDWGGTIECASCHKLNAVAAPQVPGSAVKEAAGRRHPAIVQPDRLVYETDYDDGKLVTFYHDEHVRLYGFGCADCHKNESCATCHTGDNSVVKRVSVEDKHELCSKCHDVDDGCEHCHKSQAMPPFDHRTRTGFDLAKYHDKLSCTQCHGSAKKFAGVSGNCTSCHSDWGPGTFDHRVTGLLLNEVHSELACEECHVGKQFTQERPSCDGCHESDVTYPASLPGTRVKTRK